MINEKDVEQKELNEENLEDNLDENLEDDLGDDLGDDLEGEDKPDKEPSDDEYVPNYKFKVHDNEYEIDEEFRPIIKSKDAEEKVRAILSKAHGLEEVQKSRDSWKEKYESTQGETSQLKEVVDKIQYGVDLYQKGDLLGAAKYFFKPEDLKTIAIEVAKYEQMEPNQRQMIDREYETRLKSREYETRESDATKRAMVAEAKAVQATIDYELTRPDIAELAEKVDSMRGEPGFFKKRILQHGDTSWKAGNKITAQQAINAVVEDYKPFIAKLTPTPASQPTGKKVVAPSGTKTAPNLKGSGSSGRQAKPARMSDLAKIREKLEQENQE